MKEIIVVLIASMACAGCASSPLFKPSTADRVSYVQSIKDVDPNIKKAIEQGLVVKGMTKEDVLASWGKPHSIGNRKIAPQFYKDNEEQWEYRWDIVSMANKFVHFKDGIVDSVDFLYE
ncbi:MAG: hypothetical protein NTU54_05485 [Candidatus Omnitrophica bacterium]|nr:hypothetical protein [Candidatus Omnitrophota bacterium]